MKRSVSGHVPNPFVAQHYLVEGMSGWFVICCATKRIAHSWGVREFGRGNVIEVRQACLHELSSYLHLRGLPEGYSLPFEDTPS